MKEGDEFEKRNELNKNRDSYIPGKNNYSINPKYLLGKGSFRKIYSGTNKTTGKEVTIKLEPADNDQHLLIYE